RDRVQEGGEQRERRLEPAVPVRQQRRGERDRHTDADGDRGQLDVLDQARLKSRAEVVEEPAGAELVVLHDAGRPLGVVRDDGAAGSERDQGSAHTGAGFRPPESTAAIASKLTVPVGFPSPSSTTTWVAPSVSISDNASRRLVSA